MFPSMRGLVCPICGRKGNGSVRGRYTAVTHGSTTTLSVCPPATLTCLPAQRGLILYRSGPRSRSHPSSLSSSLPALGWEVIRIADEKSSSQRSVSVTAARRPSCSCCRPHRIVPVSCRAEGGALPLPFSSHLGYRSVMGSLQSIVPYSLTVSSDLAWRG
jgi:hypothetical protein